MEGSDVPSTYLSLRQAAEAAGCSESTLRRLVKSGEVPHFQEDTRTGFRYLIEASSIPVIAHKASMRRPAGRPAARRVGGPGLQDFSVGSVMEASRSEEKMAALQSERDVLRLENERLWRQLDRLTETMSRLALPASNPPDEEGSTSEGRRPQAGRFRFWDWFWDWFWGREEGK
jgi:hypothetical protein